MRNRPEIPIRSSIHAFRNTMEHARAIRNRIAAAGRISPSNLSSSQLFFFADLSPRKSDPDLSFAPARETIQPSTALAVEKLSDQRRSRRATASGSRRTNELKSSHVSAPTRTHAPALDHHSRSSSPVILLLTPTDST